MRHLHLPIGLGETRVTAFSNLIADITGKRLRTAPYLAPALLFSAPESQRQIGMPEPDATTILIHDYQAITCVSELPFDTAVDAEAIEKKRANVAEYSFSLSTNGAPIAQMTTALRLFPRQDLSSLKPTQFRNIDQLGDIAVLDDLRIRQGQTDAYQTLSGDMNPIHHDTAEAASLGLAAPIVPGLLLAATLQPVLEDARPELRLKTMKTRFMAPLCIDAPFIIALQDRGAAPDGESRIRAYHMRPDASALAVSDLSLRNA